MHPLFNTIFGILIQAPSQRESAGATQGLIFNKSLTELVVVGKVHQHKSFPIQRGPQKPEPHNLGSLLPWLVVAGRRASLVVQFVILVLPRENHS